MDKEDDGKKLGICFRRLVSKAELAEAIQKSPRTIERWVNEGWIEGPDVRFSKRSLFWSPSLANLIIARGQNKGGGKNVS